ncbi:Cu(I)-responsive transcriptional regulator [Methylobacterium isbiliense]|uniref:HTH-type transcriptional regulator HmrR n=1 Tax=Methylobacterium isbiliense TaxID=315478 RepID=A0ABQ4SN14_9HYPH|nr:Cu(I)-responsive transcriptional regulator [Methylobacterium isbiliense]MDN3625953.1 Cu(I)-responsive transcriptional regulator [Methylobacterium isbiliense]GJE04622.1 HTH-type transcriptional regulator HmrR [Methylobacterium isbiliense]
MNIGQAAQASGISAKMIRYYESIGLVPPAGRRGSGYRDYGPADLHRLGFIRRARDLGFSVERIRLLLELWSDQGRSNAEVKVIALTHINELEGRAQQLQEMAGALRTLANACDGDGRPDCPIIQGLEAGEAPACHGAPPARQ